MKALFKLPLLALMGAMLIFTSCRTGETEEVVVNGLYKIDIPSYMDKGLQLNEDASLQYQNLLLEVYTVVIDEPKQDYYDALDGGWYDEYSRDLKGYTDIARENLMSQNDVDVTFSSEMKSITVNGMPAFMMDYTAEFEGMEIFYLSTIIEGEDHFYQVMSWTANRNKEDYRLDFEKMVNSFAEVR